MPFPVQFLENVFILGVKKRTKCFKWKEELYEGSSYTCWCHFLGREENIIIKIEYGFQKVEIYVFIFLITIILPSKKKTKNF